MSSRPAARPHANHHSAWLDLKRGLRPSSQCDILCRIVVCALYSFIWKLLSCLDRYWTRSLQALGPHWTSALLIEILKNCFEDENMEQMRINTWICCERWRSREVSCLRHLSETFIAHYWMFIWRKHKVKIVAGILRRCSSFVFSQNQPKSVRY